MLTDLTFDIEKLNARYADRGVTFSTKEVEGGTLYQYNIDPNHMFWKDKNHTPSTKPFSIAGREDLGIYYGHSLGNSIKQYFEDDLNDEFSSYDLVNGTAVSRDDYSKLWDLDCNNHELRDRILNHTAQSYGVADSIEQVLLHFHKVITNPNIKVLFSFHEVRREDCPESGGWRWHKNGEYIGTQKPTHEYLYDDTHIDSVLMYHIYSIK